MPYVFYDLPADSAELETYNGYQVSRIVHKAGGSLVKRPDPSAPPAELILQGPRRPWFEPVLARMPATPGRSMVRRSPSRAWCTRGFISARALASLLCVPSFCFAIGWLMGRI
ncbi:MAG: hypothetical protein KDB90_02250 [Planctomycetes bacterium]|nr:hypothetical protein [Planctomycetota bacterium]